MLISSGQLNITVSGAEGSENTNYIRGLCHHIVAKPDTETTQYDISITNPAGAKIYERLSETGTLSELVTIPVLGVYTVAIANSTKDENFIVQIICQE